MSEHRPERRRLNLVDEEGGETSFIFYICVTCTPDLVIKHGQDIVEWPCPAAPDTCRVYWGHAGCDLPRSHDADQPIRTHRQFEPSEHAVTPKTAYLFGEDLTEAERVMVHEEWD